MFGTTAFSAHRLTKTERVVPEQTAVKDAARQRRQCRQCRQYMTKKRQAERDYSILV